MEEIGRRLQATRVAKGLTLQEVEDETRIRKKYIEALESGRTASIPGEVYVKGFLRTYGNFLGLDGEGLVEEYKAGPTPDPAVADAAAAAQVNPIDTAQANPTAATRTQVTGATDATEVRAGPLAIPSGPPRPPAFVSPPPRAGSRRAEQVGRRVRAGGGKAPGPMTFIVRRIVVTLVVLVPLLGGGYWLFGRMTTAPVTPPAPPPPVTEQNDPNDQPSPQPEPEPAPPPEPPKPQVTMTGPQGLDVNFAVSAAEVELRMEFREGYPWLEVYDEAGKTLYWAIAKGPVEFKGKNLRVNVGFVAGLDLIVNGESFPHGLKGGPYWLNFKSE